MKHSNFEKLLILLVSLGIVFVLARSTLAQKTQVPIKIGLLYDLTGLYSVLGKDLQNGATTWVEWANSQGGIKGHPIQLISLDGQSDATKAALAVRKLIEVENVYAIAGCNNTGIALAVGPVCEKSKIPFVTATGSEVFEHELKPYWSFRVCTTTWEMVDWGFGSLRILDPKIKNISILYHGVAFGKQAVLMAERYAPMRGLKIVTIEKYEPTATDFGAQISSIMKSNPDAVAVYCSDMAGPLAMKQMREMGMKKPIVTNGAISSKAVRDAFKDAFSIPPYVYSAGTKPDVWRQLPKDSIDYKVLAPVGTRFEEKYQEQYTWFNHLAVNNMVLITNSVERALNEDSEFLNRDLQTIRTGIRDKMETIKNVQCGGFMVGSPKNHNVLQPGTGIATFHFEKGKIVYDAKLSNINLNSPPPIPD